MSAMDAERGGAASLEGRRWCTVAILLLVAGARAAAQETPGIRAGGLAGAFTAVADDSSAVWWNPAALAAGPFADVTGSLRRRPGGDTAPHWLPQFAVGLPMLGLGWDRADVTARSPVSIDASPGGREEDRTGVSVRTLDVSRFGVALVHSLATGLHVGTTLSYMRGSVVQPVQESTRSTRADGAGEGAFDATIAAFVQRGAISAGVAVHHLTAPRVATLRVPRRARVGLAWRQDGGAPATVSLDLDVLAAPAVNGPRRQVALGLERGLAGRRLTLRAGVRFDTDGAAELGGTAGASVALRAGTSVDVHLGAGGPDDLRSWGIGLRASF